MNNQSDKEKVLKLIERYEYNKVKEKQTLANTFANLGLGIATIATGVVTQNHTLTNMGNLIIVKAALDHAHTMMCKKAVMNAKKELDYYKNERDITLPNSLQAAQMKMAMDQAKHGFVGIGRDIYNRLRINKEAEQRHQRVYEAEKQKFLNPCPVL